jgi:hypothetical protein
MNERKDEKWLDEQLQRVVNGLTPTFNAKAWKQKYAGEFQTLLRRAGQPSPRPSALRLPPGLTHLFRVSLGRLAMAAGILVVAGVLFLGRFGSAPLRPSSGVQTAAQDSPAQMVSMIALSAAFRSGGMEGLNNQCDRALERLGPRPTSVSMQELFKDIDGKGLGKAKI